VVLLRPLLVTRIANMVPGVAILLLGGPFAGWLAGLALYPESLVMLVFSAALAPTMAIRGYRMGVTVTRESVVIRNLTRSRTVPRALVVGVTSWLWFPAVKWRAPSGRARRTIITAFGEMPGPYGTPLNFVSRHADESVERLRNMLEIARTPALRPGSRRRHVERGDPSARA